MIKDWLASSIITLLSYYQGASKTLESIQRRTVVFWVAGIGSFFIVVVSALLLKNSPIILTCIAAVVIVLAIGWRHLSTKLGLKDDNAASIRSERNAPRASIVLAVTLGAYLILSRMTYGIIATVALVLGVAFVYWLSPGLFIIIPLLVILILVSVIVGGATSLSMSTPVLSLPPIHTTLAMKVQQPSAVLENAHIETDETGFDLFQDRISAPFAVEGIIEGLRQTYSFPAEDVAFQAFADHLRSLYREMVAESRTEKLAVVGVMALTAGYVGYLLAERMLGRMKAKLGERADPRIMPIIDELQSLFTFFKLVSRSRFAEIVEATRLPEGRVRILLKVGPFTHEKACFWRFADQTDVEQIKARERSEYEAAFFNSLSRDTRPEPSNLFTLLCARIPIASNQRVSKLDPLDLARLYSNLSTHFNREELCDLCFNLGINYENLPSRFDSMAREIVADCARHGRIRELVVECRRLRPNFHWEDLSE